MHYDRILGPHTIKHLERATALNHEVLRDRLEPVHAGVLFQDLRIMAPAQTDAKAKRFEI